MLKKILLLIAIVTTIAIAYGSLISSDDLPDVEVDYADKVIHAIAYGFLCFIWYLAIKSYNIQRPLLVAICIAVIYGILLEVLQGTLTEARVTDLHDILANCIGVVFISLIIAYRNKTHVKKI